LATGVLDDARKKGLTVVPLCPFIAGYIERHSDYADLVAG
jgi:predicted GNAT family acetyltransferase